MIDLAILKINPNAEFSVNKDLYDLDKAEITWDAGTTPITKEDIKAGVQGHAPRPDYNTYKKGSYHDYDVGGDKPPRWEKQPKNDMGGK